MPIDGQLMRCLRFRARLPERPNEVSAGDLSRHEAQIVGVSVSDPLRRLSGTMVEA